MGQLREMFKAATAQRDVQGCRYLLPKSRHKGAAKEDRRVKFLIRTTKRAIRSQLFQCFGPIDQLEFYSGRGAMQSNKRLDGG